MKKILLILCGIMISTPLFAVNEQAGFNLSNEGGPPLVNYYDNLILTCNGNSKTVGPTTDTTFGVSDLFSGDSAKCRVTAKSLSGGEKPLAAFTVVLSNQKKNVSLKNLTQYTVCKDSGGTCKPQTPIFTQEVSIIAGIENAGPNPDTATCFCPVRVVK